jgi:glycyl-tRNA synthetase (class II)
VRDRDTGKQERVKVAELVEFLNPSFFDQFKIGAQKAL